MNGRAIGIVASIVIAAALALPGAAAAKGSASDVTIEYWSNPFDERIQIFGAIDSDSAKCERGRKVSVYVSDVGKDPLLGYTFSDSFGYWTLQFTSSDYPDTTSQVVYAEVEKEKRGKTVCKADMSAAFTLD